MNLPKRVTYLLAVLWIWSWLCLLGAGIAMSNGNVFFALGFAGPAMAGMVGFFGLLHKIKARS